MSKLVTVDKNHELAPFLAILIQDNGSTCIVKCIKDKQSEGLVFTIDKQDIREYRNSTNTSI